MKQMSRRISEALRAICVTRRRSYGTFIEPNPNISNSRIEFLIRFSRLKHLLFYTASAFRKGFARINLGFPISERNRVFFVCANTPTHTSIYSLIPEEFDVVILPPGVKSENFSTLKSRHLADLLAMGDILCAVWQTVQFFAKGKQSLPIGIGDFIWLLVSMIEAQALRKVNAKSIFLTHHLDAAALSAVLCEADEYLAGMHGFPIAEYGWTPVWTDYIYVYGESTRNYIVRLDPVAKGKIKYYINRPDYNLHDKSYVQEYLGLIVGGSHEDLDDLMPIAESVLVSKIFCKVIVFRHPSRSMTNTEIKRIKNLSVPYEITTLSTFPEDICLRCLIGNSTAALTAITKGHIVFFVPTNLPRIDGFFRVDGLVLSNSDNLLHYEYPGKEAHRDAISSQIKFHFN
jgi:hypothetical protein